jgi:ribosomal protein S18 acetylase RimI-like enzyme
MEPSQPTDPRWRFRVLGHADAAELQRFFDANPEFFLRVEGQPPGAQAAAHELDDAPPPELAYREMLVLGVDDGADPGGAMVGMASVVGDFIAEHVWHIGLFIVATALHGSGAAQEVYAALERWMRERGAHWIRLGVVVGNTRAEHFWRRLGYVETRQRGPVTMGRQNNMLRVMVKPLTGGSVGEYLAAVARDRPESP